MPSQTARKNIGELQNKMYFLRKILKVMIYK